MAKVRVYELAKDLNMTNKQLLEKLKELGIDAKSHMSALGNSDVAAVKQNLLGKKKRSNNEVKVRRSVIRRRKTKTTSQTDEQERDEDMDDSFEAEEPTVKDSADQEGHGIWKMVLLQRSNRRSWLTRAVRMRRNPKKRRM